MKKRVSHITLILFLVTGFIYACNSNYTAKRRGYFKIDFPQHTYQVFDKSGYPYTFEYPTYARVVQDSTFFEEAPENPYWINIEFPQFNGKIYVSYNIIGGKAIYKVKTTGGQYRDSIGVNTFHNLLEGSYKLTYKHTYKASVINDSAFVTPNGVDGIWFNIEGNAATANQFLVSDSSRHFLRGALYFDAPPNADSLKIVNDFLQQDMKHLINTLKWR